VLLILATGFFVAAEFAYVAVDRSRIERLAREGRRSAQLADRTLRRLSLHLSGAQLGITITSVVLGFIAEPTVARLLEAPVEAVLGEGSARGVSIALALVLVTVASMVISELVPKNIAIAKPVPTALALAPAASAYNAVFGPLIRFFNGAANWTVRRLGIEPQEELTSVRSLEELELLVEASGEEGTLDEEAFTLLTRTLRFGNKTAADALVPRFEVVTARPEDSLVDLVASSARSGFSRFPVCRDDLDDVVGVVHVKDVAGVAAEHRAATRVAAVMTQPFVVPETRDLGSLLGELRQAGSHLAIVVDEYGGTAGVITLEDVLEEIVGEISDEYDPAPKLSTVLPEGTYVLPGGLHLDEVEEACAFEIPEGEYETLAGFVLDRLGRIPAVGESFEHEGWRVEVAEMDRRRVATVKLLAPERPR
jgi:CBS domain containing-hemolysin-like protein